MEDDEVASEEFNIRHRNHEGDWVELGESTRPWSDDPEINELGELTLSDVTEISEDQSHPLYEKAKKLLAEQRIQIPRTSTVFPWEKRMAQNFLPFIDPMQRFKPLMESVVGRIKSGFMPYKLGSWMLDAFEAKWPPNWPKNIDLDDACSIFQDEGLPLVWVPRLEFVEQLIELPDRTARLDFLLQNRHGLIEDCDGVLMGISHEQLAGQLFLVQKALRAYAAGHDEAAQALAVVATDTAVMLSPLFPNGYGKNNRPAAFDPATISYRHLRLMAALAPMDQFYTRWFLSSGELAPMELSRHVTVHPADTRHYTPANSLIAVLLATSVLRALQEFYELPANKKNEDVNTDED